MAEDKFFDVLNTMRRVKPYADIDGLKGPFNSVQEGLNATRDLRLEGKSFYVLENGKRVEYVFEGGIEDSNLVRVTTPSGGGEGGGIEDLASIAGEGLEVGADGKLKVTNGLTTEQEQKLEQLDDITPFTPDGETIVVGEDGKASANVSVNIASISTTQTSAQLTALADGLYFANGAGDYNITISNPSTGVTVANGKTTVESGYSVSFTKKGSVWSLASAVSIPTDSRIGIYNKIGFPDFVKVISMTNILSNNNFTSIWGGATYLSEGVLNNIYKWKATAQNGRVEGSFPSITGNSYLLKISVKANTNIRVGVPGVSTAIFHSGNGQWEDLIMIFKGVVTSNTAVNVRDSRASDWDSVEIKKGVIINLTESYGVGNEPSLIEMNSVLSNLTDKWFLNTYSYEDKNLYDNKYYAIRNGNVVLEDIQSLPLFGKKIVCFGDSITEFGNYPDILSQKTGATVYNCGIGGTRLADTTNLANYNELCFVNLVRAIDSEDWVSQDAAIEALKQTGDDNTIQYNLLRSINFAEIDYVIFMYGTNDSASQSFMIGTNTDTTTLRNIKGSLNYVLTTFSTKFKNIQLYGVTPIFRLLEGTNNSDVEAGRSGLFLNDIGKAIVEMCNIYHVPCLDLYNNSGINQFNALDYIQDGTHPTLKGYARIADKISKFILSR